MTSPFIRRAVAATLAVMCIACGGDGGTDPEPTIAGTWRGDLTAQGSTSAVTLTLQQSGTAVTGNGSIVGAGGSAALTVGGSFTRPNMSLTISSPGFNPITYAGSVNGNTMSGAMNGSGFTNLAVTLTRQ